MEKETKIVSNTNGRWLQLVIGITVMLFSGIIYSWSVLKAPFTRDFSWTAAQLGVNYTITIIFFCIGGFISGLLTKKTTIRLRGIVGAILIFAGFFITSRINSNNLITLYVSYGFLSGLGIGITYNTVLSNVLAWFPDKKGLASGSLLMGFALTTLIIGNIASNHLGTDSWRTTYLVLAIITAAIIIIASFLLKKPPVNLEVPPAKAKVPVLPSYAFEKKDYTAVEMLKRASFWKLFIFLTITAAVGTAAISFAKDILVDVGTAQKTAVVIVGLISLFNGIGRLVAGTLFDNLGLRKTQYITSALSIAATLIVILALVVKSLPICIIGLCLCYFSYGFVPTTNATFSGEFYGAKNFPLNMSIMTLQLIPSAFIATLAGNLKTATGSFESTFVILVFGTLIALGINLSIKKP